MGQTFGAGTQESVDKLPPTTRGLTALQCNLFGFLKGGAAVKYTSLSGVGGACRGCGETTHNQLRFEA